MILRNQFKRVSSYKHHKSGIYKKRRLSRLKHKKGGKGKSGISTREDDFVVQIFTANTLTPVLFFSTQGLVYKIKAHKIPEGTAASKGKSIFNILPSKATILLAQ